MLSAFRVVLLFMATMVLVLLHVLHVTSTSTSTSEDDASPNQHARGGWLRLHPPRQVSHDAELLRRRILASLVELPPAQLAEHVPAIAASLDHDDSHVRALAISMLSRLEAPALQEHGEVIASKLEHAVDEQVRLAVVRALGRASPPVLAAHADGLLRRLTDDEPAVRWAAVDALSGLEADALAPITLTAVDTLVSQHELSLARAAVAAWSPKLVGKHADVMSALAQISGVEVRGLVHEQG